MRILVVDDDPGLLIIVGALVRDLGHECLTASDGQEAWDVYLQVSPDVVVSDRMMPGLDGLELCRRIRASDAGYTYVILLTALSDPKDILAGMSAGADDYVAKPLDPFSLETRLIAAERVTALHRELGAARVRLARLATTDTLTGLLNRQSLQEELTAANKAAERYGRGYCVALCDVDLFKAYNDTYGHLAGDDALRAIARALREGVREIDKVFRFGGEEFLLLLPEQTADGARQAVTRILERVSGLGIEHRTGLPIGVMTLSAGVACYDMAGRPTPDELLAEADRALYRAKEQGRDRVEVASPGRAIHDGVA